MVQGLQAKVPAQAGVWVEAKARVEAEWAVRLPLDRVEIVYAQVAAIQSLMLQGNLVMQKVVQNVVRK